ncbi:protein disulfide isomerase-like 2-3 [Panicum virgatum]|uniref:protein disulfide isomerase-like 2-3 n=1 Tax=Panicum virgatum TaxID=38727 RepID=UPI0019D4F1E7|nr:protein disulfide isomerase-like 2-3 [Panicum virgatum]
MAALPVAEAGGLVRRWGRRFPTAEAAPPVAALLLAATATSPAAALYSAGSPVLQLDPNNFKSKMLNSNRVVLVEFFASWCGHCKQLALAWEKAAHMVVRALR